MLKKHVTNYEKTPKNRHELFLGNLKKKEDPLVCL